MEKQTNKTIVKINASLEQANKWKQNAKELNKSRSDYLLDIIEQNNKPSLLELIVNKIKRN